MHIISLTTFLLTFYFLNSALQNEEQVYHVSLNGDSTIKLHWILDYNKENVVFELHIFDKFEWFAVGFSNRGQSYPGDYCILWKDIRKKFHFQDVWVDSNGVAHLDKHQNCNNFKIKSQKKVTKFTFQRQFDTCDSKDYVIEEGTTHIVWAKGDQRLFKVEGFNISSTQNDNSGMVRVQLLKNTEVQTQLPLHVKTFDVVTQKVQIPALETMYWCHVQKLDKEFEENKHHVYRYEPHIQKSSEGVVHHMEVFHCEANPKDEIPLYRGNCFAKERPKETQVCKRVLAAWAMGAPAFTYPYEAGLPLGGADFNPYVMLEVHYNNPERKADLVDSSGIRFHVSTKLKQMDAGVMELGLEYTDKMAIPPVQISFPLTGYCVSECTAVSLPPEGITIFASQLHTHLTGVRASTRHIRDGMELKEINRDDHYSTHFQEIRRLKTPIKVLQGDALVTRCDYNTEDRSNITLGGFAITDEMCVNYVHYFPKTDLEVCKSAISDQALSTYFEYMKNWEGQKTSRSKPISENYQTIEWNKMRVQLLQEVYSEAPLSMQCNMSSGNRFPGYWENTPITPILRPLPPPVRSCE